MNKALQSTWVFTLMNTVSFGVLSQLLLSGASAVLAASVPGQSRVQAGFT